MIRIRRSHSLRAFAISRHWQQKISRLGMVMGAVFVMTIAVAAIAQEPVPAPAVPATLPENAPPPAAAGDAAATPASPPKKIVNNPFAPGGVTTSEQTISRKEVVKLITEMEDRLRKELGGDMNSEAINKLILNAAGAGGGISAASDNHIGCVNGVPLYRDEDGALTLGTKEPEELKLQRCPR